MPTQAIELNCIACSPRRELSISDGVYGVLSETDVGQRIATLGSGAANREDVQELRSLVSRLLVKLGSSGPTQRASCTYGEGLELSFRSSHQITVLLPNPFSSVVQFCLHSLKLLTGVVATVWRRLVIISLCDTR